MLQAIAEEICACQRCPLGRGRIKAVPGDGPANPRVMLIGEAPGQHEDRQGRPFVGAAGQFLNELLAAARLRREDVFITNIVKCRPPGNRDPEPEEIAACGLFLSRQIAAIRPQVIVTLGRHSLGRFFPGQAISRIHGRPSTVGTMTVFPMYHPAAALHQPTLRKTLLDDMAKLPAILTLLGPRPAVPPPAEPPRQLSLF